MASVLFLLVIGDIINSAILKHVANFNNSGIRWTMSPFLQHLHYVDDICLLLHSVLDIEKAASSAGLNINASNTKSMHMVNSRATKPSNSILTDRRPVVAVEQFTYLASEICMAGGSDADVECRIRKAKDAFGMLAPVRNKSCICN